MKAILLSIAVLPLLCSCGATGRIVGTVATLPIDIVRAGTGLYQEDNAHDGSISELIGNDPAPLSYAE